MSLTRTSSPWGPRFLAIFALLFIGLGLSYSLLTPVFENSDETLHYPYCHPQTGSAALDLCYVAAGRFDGYRELKIHPWDVAGGCLRVTEAGGKVTDFKGENFSIYEGDILASNGWIHEEMLRIIQEID